MYLKTLLEILKTFDAMDNCDCMFVEFIITFFLIYAFTRFTK